MELTSQVLAKFAPTAYVQDLLTFICDNLYLLPDAKGTMQKMWKEIADTTFGLHRRVAEVKDHDYVLNKEVPFTHHRALPIYLSKYGFYTFENEYATNIFVDGYAAVINTLGRHRGTIFSYPNAKGADFTFHSHCQNLILMGNENIVKAMSVLNIVVCSGDKNIIDFYNDGNQLYCYGDGCIISNRLSDLSSAAKSKIYVYGSDCRVNLDVPVKYLYVAPENEVILRGAPLAVPVRTFLVWKDGEYVPE